MILKKEIGELDLDALAVFLVAAIAWKNSELAIFDMLMQFERSFYA